MATLQDFENVKQNLKNSARICVEALHKLVFEYEGDRNNRQRLREFAGFEFVQGNEEYEKKFEYVQKNLSPADLTSICILLGLNYKQPNLVAYLIEKLTKNKLLQYVANNEDEDQGDNVDGTEQVREDNENADSNEERSEGGLQDPTLYAASTIHSSNNKQKSCREQQMENKITKRFALNFRDVEDSVRSFDGSSGLSVEAWVQEFEEMSVLMEWDPLQMVIFAKKSLKGIAKLFISGERGLSTWNLLRDALLDEFGERMDSAQILDMLKERKMQNNESVLEYFYHMKDIAARGCVEDTVIIRFVIKGIRDSPANKSMLYGAKNIKEFKEKLRNYEMFSKEEKTYNEKAVAKQKVYSSDRSTEKKRVYNTNEPENKPIMKCYNCGANGHVSSNCYNKSKGTKCFRCNKFGHVARECKIKIEERKPSDVGFMNVQKLTADKDIMRKSVKIANQIYAALFDTGCKVNLINAKLYEMLKPVELITFNIVLRGFGQRGNKIQPLGKVSLDVEIDGSMYCMEFNVVPNDCMEMDMVIGYPICEHAEILINAEGVHIQKREETQIMNIGVEMNKEIDIDCNVSSTSKQIVHDLIAGYVPNKTKTTNVTMKINLIDETPIASGPRRLPHAERYIVEDQIEQWLQAGIIENSESEFSSPVVLVPKKDGGKRLCVDYRRINRVIIRDRFPLPLIEDQLDRLQNAKIFSTIDLKNGFFHVPVDEDSRKYTAFVTHSGQFQFLATPFGFANSPAVFQRHINAIFREMTHRGIALPYVDDIIIPARNEEEAVQNLKEVIEQCENYGLNINLKKCHFLKRKIEFLGHVIENGTISPSPAKKEVMINYPIPKTMKQLESFLGLAGYFRKFIPDFAQIAKPLSDLKKNNNKFVMGTEQIESFYILKQKLTENPVLKIFNECHQTELHTDASAQGYGAVLMQQSPDDGKMHPVYYMSKKTTDAEAKYDSYELEILAVVEALKKFRVYLLGIQFKIITDCNAFAKTMSKKDLCTRVSRWLLLLQEYDYTIEHRSGTRMRHVDALSRMPVMMIEAENILTKVARSQKEDEDLKLIFEILQQNDTYNDYYLKSQVLYRVVNGCELLVIPKVLEYEIIKKAHEKGHFSVQKTKNLIVNDYYIPKLEDKIQRCINNCIQCIMSNRKRGKQAGELHPIPKQDIPLYTYHVDHLGPLESTSKQYNHIFVVIDSFTKFCWLYPTKSTTAKETISKLQLQGTTFGNPKVIISDRGTAFTAEDFGTYCKEEGIFHHKITTGLPRANGQVERLNSVIISVLSKLSIDDPGKWYKYVPKVQQVINSTYHRSTSATPFELLIGIKMRCQEDLKIKQAIEEEMINTYDEARKQLRQCAKEQIIKVQEENRRTYNLRRRPANIYKLGDTVAIKRTQFGRGLKLKAKYLGPYVVTTVKGNDTYDVAKIGHHEGPNKTSTCAEYMKPWPNSDFDSFGTKD